MALFGTPSAFLGLDIGSSSLKLVELVNRRRRIEIATYAQASFPNLLINPQGDERAAVSQTADTVAAMLDRANVSTDAVVAALPNSVVFSTVLTLPSLPEKEIDKAIHFAARDVVPADLDDMVLGWSRLCEAPHMDTDQTTNTSADLSTTASAKAEAAAGEGAVPVFVTAAPKDIVNRYLKLMDILKLQLHALEVETFPLVRSLFENVATATGLVADIGDRTTTLHIIEAGTPRLSHTIEYGGYSLTSALAEKLGISAEEAEQQKIAHGLSASGPPPLREATLAALEPLVQQARNLLGLYQSQGGQPLSRTILIGGGANL
ncbi:MAG: pilus assembly protein PilM, partial [Patescibacteria group bacterium]